MNILVLTSVYPHTTDNTQNTTKVVKYFVVEWIKQGHNVLVVHNAHRYLRIVHMLPHKIKEKIAARINFYIPDYKDIQEKYEKQDQASVYRLPIFKMIPHAGHSIFSIKRQAKKIEGILQRENFEPDIMVGHWMSPQIQIISKLKANHPCRTALVLHGREYVDGNRFNYSRYLAAIDRIGCRSKSDAEYLQKEMNLNEMPFICYSGIPDEYVFEYMGEEKFKNIPKVWKFVFVGRLVKYKNVDKIIIALSKLDNYVFTFDIIGDGSEREYLERLADKYKLSANIFFRGALSRDHVRTYLNDSHCFIMASEREVFGLVYLEAMSAGCITIGSKGGGIDGVIVDNKNGFLCDAGNPKAIEDTLRTIMGFSYQELQIISKAGYETACRFTDSVVAMNYLESIE